MFRRKPRASVPLRLTAISEVACRVSPGDKMLVRGAVNSVRGPEVILLGKEGTESTSIVLAPAEARQFAAAILNAVDEVDGLKSLFEDVTPEEAEL